MEICICGWHYHEPFYSALAELTDRFTITVIAHREGYTAGIRTIKRPNVGLDWGAYSYYLKNCWYGSEPVLFLQDDTRIHNPKELERIASIPFDQAFIFRDEHEAKLNDFGHGRAIFCSRAFLYEVTKEGGFYFDPENRGFIAPGHFLDIKPPSGCQHHNAGIHAFMTQTARIAARKPSMKVSRIHLSPGLEFGRRGKFD